LETIGEYLLMRRKKERKESVPHNRDGLNERTKKEKVKLKEK